MIAPSVEEKSRAPLRLVAVLDKSGSMGGSKIRLVRKTMLFVLKNLGSQDAIGLVEFDSDVKVLAPLTHCDESGKSRLEAVLKNLKAGSTTNLSGGLLQGLTLHADSAVTVKAKIDQPLSKIKFGNTYQLLPDDEEHGSDFATFKPMGAKRVHEWTLELRVDELDAAFINKVIYTLHPSFSEHIIEVIEPPFRLTRIGWGTFTVVAEIQLKDGRSLTVSHELSFDKPENFQTELLQLRLAPTATTSTQNHQSDQIGVVRSTFLFTDGLANAGLTKAEAICAAATSKLDELGCNRCTLSTFGFGSDHDAELLQGLAQRGEGIYSYVENEDMIGDAFGEAMGGLLTTSHQNVNLSLQLAPGVSLIKAFTAFPVKHQDGGYVDIMLGDLFAEERRDVLLSLNVPEAISEGTLSLGVVRARGFCVSGLPRTEESERLCLQLERCKSLPVADSAHWQVARHRHRHEATEALAGARTAARSGDLRGARKLVQTTIESLGSSAIALAGDALILGLVTDLKDCLKDLQEEVTYHSVGSKKMASMQSSYQQQRSTYGQSYACCENFQSKSMAVSKNLYSKSCR